MLIVSDAPRNLVGIGASVKISRSFSFSFSSGWHESVLITGVSEYTTGVYAASAVKQRE